jgi:hypothetical protein
MVIDIKSASLEHYGSRTHNSIRLAAAFGTIGDGIIVETLSLFKTMAASPTFILINRHVLLHLPVSTNSTICLFGVANTSGLDKVRLWKGAKKLKQKGRLKRRPLKNQELIVTYFQSPKVVLHRV